MYLFAYIWPPAEAGIFCKIHGQAFKWAIFNTLAVSRRAPRIFSASCVAHSLALAWPCLAPAWPRLVAGSGAKLRLLTVSTRTYCLSACQLFSLNKSRWMPVMKTSGGGRLSCLVCPNVHHPHVSCFTWFRALTDYLQTSGHFGIYYQ